MKPNLRGKTDADDINTVAVKNSQTNQNGCEIIFSVSDWATVYSFKAEVDMGGPIRSYTPEIKKN